MKCLVVSVEYYRNGTAFRMPASALADVVRLSDVQKGHLLALLLFASSNKGRIPCDPPYLRQKCGLETNPSLDALVASGFFRDGGEMPEPKRPGGPKESAEFLAFWEAYPRKDAKATALQAWLRINPDAKLCTDIMAALERHKASKEWQKDEGQFIPHPSTWLNQQRFKDEGTSIEAPLFRTDL